MPVMRERKVGVEEGTRFSQYHLTWCTGTLTRSRGRREDVDTRIGTAGDFPLSFAEKSPMVLAMVCRRRGSNGCLDEDGATSGK